jgi:beta-lactamase regulating signal transducer with metallopeptidase domain
MNPHPWQHALETAFSWTWQTSLQATVVIVLVLLVQVAFRKILTPRWSYALGLLMLLRLALPFAPASPMSIFNLGSLFSTRPATRVETQHASVVTPPAIAVTSVPAAPAALSPVLEATPVPNTIANSRPRTAINFRLLAANLWLAGLAAMLVLVARRHHRFVLALRRWEPVTEPRVLGLLADCMAALGMKKRVTVLAATGPGTPALFGIARPRLLIPADMLRRLDDRELRHIFLHELIHLRHGDVRLNWVMILCRSLHWFNPAVWLAMKKLRADQELACDAAVMARLAADERRQYGGTLLKLLGDFSAARLSPGFVPFITNKGTIKRRIVMISKFKPAGRLAVAGSLALLIALGCFTFTRAADQAGTAAPAPKTSFVVSIDRDGVIRLGESTTPVNLDQLKQAMRVEIEKDPHLTLSIHAARDTSIEPVRNVLEAAQETKIHAVSLWNGEGVGPEELKTGTQTPPASSSAGNLKPSRNIELFEQELKNYRGQIEKQEAIVDELRQQLGVMDTDPQASVPASTLSVATISLIENQRMETEIHRASLETMLTELKKLNQEQLRQLLPTTVPDEILAKLLEERNTAESAFAKLRVTLSDSHPDVQSAVASIQKTDSQIDARIKGILAGMQTQIDLANSTVKVIEERLDSAKRKDLDVTARTRPYYLEKAKLEQLKRFEEVLLLRAGQDKMNVNVPANDSVK